MKGTALITGASGGIGRELTHHFAKDGCNIIAVARSEGALWRLKNELESAYGITVTVYAADLSKREAVAKLHEELEEAGIIIDYLVNDAGIGLYGEFITTSLHNELYMIDLNIKALTHLTKLFLPGMAARNRGGVLNLASIAAFQSGPLMAVYYATKAYVLSFSEALENEMKQTNVTITALCPGPTQTRFPDRANLGESKLFKRNVMDAKTVAKAGYEGFKNGKSIVIPGGQNKVLSHIIRFLPRKTATSLARKAQERDTD